MDHTADVLINDTSGDEKPQLHRLLTEDTKNEAKFLVDHLVTLRNGVLHEEHLHESQDHSRAASSRTGRSKEEQRQTCQKPNRLGKGLDYDEHRNPASQAVADDNNLLDRLHVQVVQLLGHLLVLEVASALPEKETLMVFTSASAH